ncbi:MAG TPA: aminotransferase class V-fold PLP-dependent enzyme, partial [Candidatus Limnocylindrales bacterium]
MITRAEAERRDTADQLRGLRDAFEIEPTGPIYLDGNSLGRLPRRTVERLERLIRDEWGTQLVGGWEEWIELPARVGDLIGRHFLGARRGEVVVSDSTTVNLYKLAAAALEARPGRHAIVATQDEFPTDRYVLEGLAAARGLELRLLETDAVEGVREEDIAAALSEDVALVCLSLVNYRSSALADMAALNRLARAAGAMMLWDVSHAVGAVPIDLAASGTELAVGCTYKYLNGGPGAPAYLYVRSELQDELRPPIQGWFAQRDQFEMGPSFERRPGIAGWLVGTPPVFALTAAQAGIELVAEAGIGAI